MNSSPTLIRTSHRFPCSSRDTSTRSAFMLLRYGRVPGARRPLRYFAVGKLSGGQNDAWRLLGIGEVRLAREDHRPRRHFVRPRAVTVSEAPCKLGSEKEDLARIIDPEDQYYDRGTRPV